jgi:hypothetical protein
MPYAIIRGKNGRRHEVDFGTAPVRVEIYSSEETVEIFIEADFEALPEERRRFALINIPRHLFSEAPPQRRDVPRILYCILGVLRNFDIPAELGSCRQPRRRSARQPIKVEWHPGWVCRFHRSGMSG